MSTELGKVEDSLNKKESIEVALGIGGIRLFSTSNKIWLNKTQARKLVQLLEVAILG